MRTRQSHFANRSRSGQTGLFVVLNLTLLFACLGLAVDIGWAYFTRLSAQTAADSAAMAAAAYASASGVPTCVTGTVCNSTAAGCNNPPTTPPTNNLQAGCLYAQTNGFVNNGTTQFVTLAANTTAPPGVSGNSPNYWVQATVTAKPYTLFGSFGGVSRLTINASATAAVAFFSAGACIYVLDPTAHQAFSATGTSTTTATCGIFVNSNASDAFYEYGSPHVTASQILVNGQTSISGSSSVSPTPTINAGPQTDPLSGLAMPTFANPNGSCIANPNVGSTTVKTLDQGTYCGITIGNSAQVTFSGGTYIINDGMLIQGNSRVTFNPGLYIINGSFSGCPSSCMALQFANSTVVSGTGVTFFLTGQYTGHSIGAVQSTGSTTVNLSAPGSGTYEGMLFLQDRNLSYTTNNSLANSAASVLQGTLYFPTTSLSYSGASSTGTYTAIIAKKISFAGSSAFKNDPTGTYTGLASTVRGLIQ